MSSELSRLVLALRRRLRFGDSTRAPGTESITVEVLHGSTDATIQALIEDTGGVVRGTLPGLALASVPINHLVALESAVAGDSLKDSNSRRRSPER